ncbi:hypothetical protein CPB83DRAFT_851038 [Crepidotus variabilis]|uniref:Uncharacterized protein n=1 Tax=Crepidotus variabilis TaxID=179855 RepID=A0A9P6EJC7_9AGAR|nr:hypothetical protein CPB83DRAFT_851038 [Crepidotus variabilis]
MSNVECRLVQCILRLGGLKLISSTRTNHSALFPSSLNWPSELIRTFHDRQSTASTKLGLGLGVQSTSGISRLSTDGTDIHDRHALSETPSPPFQPWAIAVLPVVCSLIRLPVRLRTCWSMHDLQYLERYFPFISASYSVLRAQKSIMSTT